MHSTCMHTIASDLPERGPVIGKVQLEGGAAVGSMGRRSFRLPGCTLRRCCRRRRRCQLLCSSSLAAACAAGTIEWQARPLYAWAVMRLLGLGMRRGGSCRARRQRWRQRLPFGQLDTNRVQTIDFPSDCVLQERLHGGPVPAAQEQRDRFGRPAFRCGGGLASRMHDQFRLRNQRRSWTCMRARLPCKHPPADAAASGPVVAVPCALLSNAQPIGLPLIAQSHCVTPLCTGGKHTHLKRCRLRLGLAAPSPPPPAAATCLIRSTFSARHDPITVALTVVHFYHTKQKSSPPVDITVASLPPNQA